MNSAFPKLFAIGTGYIADLFEGPVEVTEKIDGSQFGFGKSLDGTVFIRSKGKLQNIDSPDKMFEHGAEYIRSIAEDLPLGYTFYGEYMSKPKHSTLAYDRIPKNHIALFGVKTDDGVFREYPLIADWAERLGVDVVPLLFQGTIKTSEELYAFLEQVSYLGGQKVEGVVVKRYEPWMFGTMIMPIKGGKFVSEQFKEVHRNDWAKDNTSKGGLEKLKAAYRTEARWNKAVQHLEEDGKLTRTPQDIGPLMKEVKRDIETEEKEEIKTALYGLYADDILRHSASGLPEWWKKELANASFARGAGWTGDQGLEQPSAQ